MRAPDHIVAHHRERGQTGADAGWCAINQCLTFGRQHFLLRVQKTVRLPALARWGGAKPLTIAWTIDSATP